MRDPPTESGSLNASARLYWAPRERGPQRAGGLGLDLATVQPARDGGAGKRDPPQTEIRDWSRHPKWKLALAGVGRLAVLRGTQALCWADLGAGRSGVDPLPFPALDCRVHAGSSARLNTRERAGP